MRFPHAMKYFTLALNVVLLGFLIPQASFAQKPSDAGVVTDWNNMVLEMVRKTPTPPPPAARAFAMMHLAMFDAVNGIESTYEPYQTGLGSPPAGASPVAAAAAAAHAVLVKLYPASKKRLDAELNHSLSKVGPGVARANGMQWGRVCGVAMLALRANDGSGNVVPYLPADESELGRWQPTPPAFLSPFFPQWPSVTPFAITSANAFLADPPPAIDSLEYGVAFAEVQVLGKLDSESRTDEQKEIAFFWEDGPTSVTPPGRWQLIGQQLAARYRLSLVDSARLFALLSMTQSDGAIVAWDTKYAYNHWRPITGIAKADVDGNVLTEPDAGWVPLIPTPPFPAYTSGHSTFSGGSAELLELLFNDTTIAIDLQTPNPPIWAPEIAGKVRSFSSLRDAAEEAGLSRIYGGIHWQYDNTAGLMAGRAVAQFVFANFLKPAAE